MTREENLHWLNEEIRTWENECKSKHPIKEALYAARMALEQEPTNEERALLKRWRDRRGVSMAEFADALDALQTQKMTALDEIRAEIDAHREKLKIMADDDWYTGKIRGYDCAIEIIDNYRTESEE